MSRLMILRIFVLLTTVTFNSMSTNKSDSTNFSGSSEKIDTNDSSSVIWLTDTGSKHVDSVKPDPPAVSISRTDSGNASRTKLSFVADLNIKIQTSADLKSTGDPLKELTINGAVENLLKYNPEVNRARLEWLASQDKYVASLGNFEPSLVGNVKLENTERPYALNGQIQNVYSGGIEGLLPTATKYNVNFSLNDIRYRFSDNTSLPSTFAGITITQPILKGIWFGKSIADVKTARIDKQIALQKYRSTLFGKIYELETAYWKLCYAQEKLKFAATSVDISQELVNDSKLQERAGKISHLESVEASAELATRLANFTDAQKELLTAINDLKFLIAGRSFLRDTLIHASTPLTISVQDSINDFDQKLSIDLYDIQPDYLQKKFELEKQQLSRDYQSDQCLPDLNIKGTCGYIVSGKLTETAWDRFADPEYRTRSGTYSAELELRIPLGMNLKERKLLDAEKRNVQSAEISLQAVQIQIENYIYASRKRITDLHKNLLNAGIVVDYRKNLLNAEIISQKAGKSNYHKIFEIEQDLTKSKQWEMENILDYKSMKAELARLTGLTLIDKNLESLVNDKTVLDKKLTDCNHNF